MSVRQLFRLVGCVALLGLCLVSGGPVHAQSQSVVRVVVVEDQTKERACKLVTQDSEIAERQSDKELQAALTDCPANSLLGVRETTLEEVQRAGITSYVVLSGDVKKDNIAVGELFEAKRRSMRNQATTGYKAASCSSVNRTSTATYAGNGGGITSQFLYTVNTSCTLSNMRDKTKTNTFSNNCWRTSGIQNGGYTWNTRNIEIYTTYTGEKSMSMSASVGNSYVQEANSDGIVICNAGPGFALYQLSYPISN